VLDAYFEAYGLNYAVLRYFNAAGADLQGRLGENHEPETHIIPLLLDAASGKLPFFSVYGTDYDTPDGSCIRDYIHVTDLADAHVRSLGILGNKSRVKLNLGANVGYSVLELAEEVKCITGRVFEVRMCQRRIGDPPVLIGANKAAKKVLGWVPMHSDINTLIETAWNWRKDC
jgi:UDP-glucose 4-epimerase